MKLIFLDTALTSTSIKNCNELVTTYLESRSISFAENHHSLKQGVLSPGE